MTAGFATVQHHVFVWTYADMTGVPRKPMIDGNRFGTEHKLNDYNHIEPIKQKRRGLAPERNVAACKEVDDLTIVRILREVKYQIWVANPIMIDWKVGSLSGFSTEEDEEKTASYT
ncbi:hypothetical protein Tco_0220735, partial [Tanacetum coccineum]